MSELQHISIAVQRRGRLERFELAWGSVRVGSASHCDVRLAPDEAAAEHLALAPQGTSLWVRALSQAPPVTLNGAPLAAAQLDRRGTLRIGEVTLSLEISEPAVRDGTRSLRARKLKQLVALLTLGVLTYFAFYAGRGESALQRHVAPSPLFDGRAEVSCRHTEAEAARTYAEDQRIVADSKRERSAFRMHDGVLAVPLYEQAAACFRAAGDDDAADEASLAAVELSERLETELHAHQVRLEFFLGRGRYGAAEREVTVLRGLLADRSDAYASWLAAVSRELRAALTQAKKG